MPEALDIKVRALDEASGVFNRVKHSIKDMAAEERASGGTALERFLKGGGALGLATFGAEEVKKFGDASREAFQAYIDGSGKVGEATDKLLAGIPIFGKFYEGAKSVVDAAEDGVAAFVKWMGASDDTVRSLESFDTQIARSNEVIKQNADAQKLLADLKRKAVDSAPGEENAIAKVNEKYRDQTDQIHKEIDALKALDDEQRRAIKTSADLAIAQAKQNELDKIATDEAVSRRKLDDEHQERLAGIAKTFGSGGDSEQDKARETEQSELARTRGIFDEKRSLKAPISDEQAAAQAALKSAQAYYDQNSSTLAQQQENAKKLEDAKQRLAKATADNDADYQHKLNEQEAEEFYAIQQGYLDKLNDLRDDDQKKAAAKAKTAAAEAARKDAEAAAEAIKKRTEDGSRAMKFAADQTERDLERRISANDELIEKDKRRLEGYEHAGVASAITGFTRRGFVEAGKSAVPILLAQQLTEARAAKDHLKQLLDGIKDVIARMNDPINVFAEGPAF